MPITPRWYKSKMWSRSSTDTQSLSDFKFKSYAAPVSRSASTTLALGRDLPFSPVASLIIFVFRAFDRSIN